MAPAETLQASGVVLRGAGAGLGGRPLAGGAGGDLRGGQGEVSAEPENIGSDSSCEKVTFNDIQNDDVARPPRPPVVRLGGLFQDVEQMTSSA
jgi:hypothetical protein